MKEYNHCEICGERFRPNDERAEMYDPSGQNESVVCHADCGLNFGYELA